MHFNLTLYCEHILTSLKLFEKMKLQQSVFCTVKLHYDMAGYIKPILYNRECAVTWFLQLYIRLC